MAAVATPSAWAACATATATAAEVARRSATWGSRAAPGAVESTRAATACAAARNMPSVMRLALATTTPRPRPGKTRALFAWAIWCVMPA